MRPLVVLLRAEEGQDLVEYALLASFIAMVSVAVLRTIGPKILAYYVRVNSAF